MSWSHDFLHRNRLERRAMAELTTFRIGGPAEVVHLECEADLPELCGRPLRLLGRGANLLVADAGLTEPVVKLGKAFAGIVHDAKTDRGLVCVGCACELTKVVAATAAEGLAGLEGLAGIPGTVGGALRMNAGGADWGFNDRAEAVELFDLRTGRHHRREARELRHRYRDGGFADAEVLLRVHLRLEPGDPTVLKQRVEATRSAKAAKQPLCERSGGCFFKNPGPDCSAGKLLDELGCKGRRVGDAAVSSKHANFVINNGAATATEVLVLVDGIRRKVLAERGIALDCEVRTWNCTPAPLEDD